MHLESNTILELGRNICVSALWSPDFSIVVHSQRRERHNKRRRWERRKKRKMGSEWRSGFCYYSSRMVMCSWKAECCDKTGIRGEEMLSNMRRCLHEDRRGGFNTNWKAQETFTLSHAYTQYDTTFHWGPARKGVWVSASERWRVFERLERQGMRGRVVRSKVGVWKTNLPKSILEELCAKLSLTEIL